MISKIQVVVLCLGLLVMSGVVMTLQNERYALMAKIAASYKDRFQVCRMDQSGFVRQAQVVKPFEVSQ